MTTLYTTLDSPLGELLLAGTERGGRFALASVSMPGQRGGVALGADWRRAGAEFTDAARQIQAYFAGELRTFDLPLAPVGSEFRRRVWRALDAIPYGSTVSYRQLAAAAGSPGAVRAVGGAVGANPLLIVRPCHRVIGANGSLTGFAGGLDRKRRLLVLEGALAGWAG